MCIEKIASGFHKTASPITKPNNVFHPLCCSHVQARPHTVTVCLSEKLEEIFQMSCKYG